MILNREDLELSSVEISLMFYSYNCVCILSLLEVRINSTRSFQNILSNEDWKSTFQSHDVLRLNDIWESLAFGSIPSIDWQKNSQIAKQKNFFFLYNQNHFDINEEGFWIILEYQWIMFFSGYCAQKKVSRSRVIKSSKTFRYLFSLAFEMFPSNLQAAYATSNDIFCWSLCWKIK